MASGVSETRWITSIVYALFGSYMGIGELLTLVVSCAGRPDMAPFKFIDRVSRGQTIQQFGDGSSSRDYTFIQDVVQGVVRSIDTPTPYKILNLGKGSGTVLKEFLELVEKYVGKKAVVEVIPDQPGDVPYTCANVTAAHEHLGYEATVPFEEGIQRTVEWYKQAYPGAFSVPQRRLRSRLGNVLASPSIGWTTDDEKLMNDALRRLLMDDSTAFDEELGEDHELFDLLLEKTGPASKRRLESKAVVLPHTQPKKILVTGGAGFVGSHVVDHLLDRGDTVVLVDEPGLENEANLEFLIRKHGEEKLKIYRGDICDTEFISKIFENENPEWICHLASRNNAAESLSDPVGYVNSNVESIVRLMELVKGAKFGGHEIRNFVMASSGDVYGRRTSKGEADGKILVGGEDDVVDYPKTPYAASQKAGELLAFTYHHLYRVPVTALRLFTAYGPRYRNDTEAFLIIDSMFTGTTTSVPMNHDFTYIDDVVAAIASSLDRPYGYEIINVASGDCEKGGHKIVSRTAEVIGKQLQPNIDVTDTDGGASCAAVAKAAHLINFKASVSLEDGVQRTVEWHKGVFYPDVELPYLATNSDVDIKSIADEVVDDIETDNALSRSVVGKVLASFSTVGEHRDKKLVEESLVAAFSSWLRSLAFLQWFLVITILIARAYFKVSISSVFGHRASPASSRSSSPVAELLVS
jgi:UDP-glucuronate 4-epimerase